MSNAQIGKDWARITIERWQTALRKKKIGISETLYNSFLYNIILKSNGDISRIELYFKFYGRFVDMGVGRGTALSATTNRTTQRARAAQLIEGRKPKKWYSKTKIAEVRRLNELLSQHYGTEANTVILEGMAE